MQTHAELGARLLKDAAGLFRTLAQHNSSMSESLVKNARLYDRIGELLATDPTGSVDDTSQDSDAPGDAAEAPTPRRQGPWLRRPAWLKNDRPAWVERGEDGGPLWRDYSPADEPLKQALKDACDETIRQLVDDSRISFAKPAFLPGIVVAHLARDESPGWDALFSITKEEEGEYKARSFDFQSPEVHRLNYVVPLNCVGHELEYLRYFMYVVRGDLGAFRLLEGSVLAEARGHLGPELEKRIRPTRFKRVAADGGLVFEANVLYGKEVFSSDLEVYPDGAVEMLEDRRIAQDIEALAE